MIRSSIYPYIYLGFCPVDYPYAFYNGYYCCNENEEKPVGPDTTESQIEDGTCDGLDFNRKSKCCTGDRTQGYDNGTYAYDNSDGMHFLHLEYKIFQTFVMYHVNMYLLSFMKLETMLETKCAMRCLVTDDSICNYYYVETTYSV